jgi:hypothetical protein
VCKICFIGYSSQHKSVESRISKVSSVEHVAEFVEVILNKFRFSTVICVQKKPLGVADGDMYPWENFSDVLFFDNLKGMTFDHLFYSDIGFGSIGRDLAVCLDAFPYDFLSRFSLEIRKDNHFDMSDRLVTGMFLRTTSFARSTFRHNKNRRLTLSASATFLLIVLFIFFRFRRKESVIYLNHSGKPVKVVTLTHNVTKFVNHLPDRLVTLMTQLTLDLKSGKAFLCGCQKMDGIEPVHKRQVGVHHNRSGGQCRFMMTFRAHPGFFALVPVLFVVAATAAYDSFLLTKFTQAELARLFCREITGKFNQFHNSFNIFFYYSKILI